MHSVLIALDEARIHPDQRRELEKLIGDGRLVITADRARMEAVAADIEIAAGAVPREIILRAPRLRWFQQWGAGAEWLLEYPEMRARDFVVTNTSGIHAIPISEHIFAFLLAFARNLPRAMRMQEKHEWAKIDRDEIFELAGKTMLLLGLGGIGGRTARLAAAMDMRVIGVRRHPGGTVPGVARVVGTTALGDVLPEADFVVVTLPLTSETRGLIGAREFARMKRTAYFVNVGRGGVVDDGALVSALRAGQIAGAGIDVTGTEPLPPDSPLWAMENVLITGHYAGITPHYDERAMEVFLDNFHRFRTGEELRNVVDKDRGY